MNNVFICTQGTSIANGCPSLNKLQSNPDPWDSENKGFEKELAEHIEAFDSSKLNSVSAEIEVLSKKKIAHGDKVVLLCTDGYLGRVCGIQIKNVMQRVFPLNEDDVKVDRVPDLQVFDGERLSNYGLKNLIDCGRKAIEEYSGQYNIYLCPNGGFKGVVPFLTVLGIHYHCNVLYTFERSKNLISLPSLPYSFNQELYSRARRALAVLTDKIEMREEEYLNNIDGYEPFERDAFLGFVQYTDTPGYVTPSPLVDSFVAQSNVSSAMLSDQAREDMKLLEGSPDYYKACRMIMNSQDPTSRHFHSLKPSTDLLAVKYTGNSALRLLGFHERGVFYIARVVSHGGSYEEAYKTQKMADFPLSRFTLWEVPKREIDQVGDDLTPLDDLKNKNDTLLCENKKIREQNERDRQENELLKKKNISLKEENKRVMGECRNAELKMKSVEEKYDAAAAQIKELEEKLDIERSRNNRPWYKKIFG